MSADPPHQPCYKCGATDHIATNRNCPRPRRTTGNDPVIDLAYSYKKPRLSDTKFIKEARMGDDTKFWYYSSAAEKARVAEMEGVETEAPREKGVNGSEKATGLGITVEEGGRLLQGVEALIELLRDKPAADADSQPAAPTAVAASVSKTPRKRPPPKSSPTTSTTRPRKPPIKTSAVSKPATAAKAGFVHGLKMPLISQEYLAWCDLPENDPFSAVNVEGREWNYLGERNRVGDERVSYGRDLQGWRECRSLGRGLRSEEEEEEESWGTLG